MQRGNLSGIKQWVLTCLCLGFLSSLSFGLEVKPTHDKKELLSALIKLNDKGIPNALRRQQTEKDKLYYGAAFDGDSVVSPIGTAHLIQTLMCSYVSPESKYYQSEETLQRMILAASGLLNLQHEDGTIHKTKAEGDAAEAEEHAETEV